METTAGRTEYVAVDGGQLAYDVVGDGPLVVLSPGLADVRATYRYLAPLIVAAGYRVARVDLRGHGESSAGWSSYTHADTAADLLAVIRHLGGPAVIVGQSFSGGAATLAAANDPALLRAVVPIAPVTRPQQVSVGALLRNDHDYRRGGLALLRFLLTGSAAAWLKYLTVAFPGIRPADWDSYRASIAQSLSDPGRVEAARRMANSKPAKLTLAEAGRRLADVRCPVLIVMGRDDSDFPNPEAEAAGIVSQLPPGAGRYVLIDGAGHYPHAQQPVRVADEIIPFLATLA